MNLKYLAFASLLYPCISFSQITNGGFEDYVDQGLNPITNAVGWFSAEGSSDLFVEGSNNNIDINSRWHGFVIYMAQVFNPCLPLDGAGL